MSYKIRIGVVLLAVLFLAIVNVTAQDLTDEELRDLAELNYEEAEHQFSLGNCRDAVGYANRSRQLYTQLGDNIEMLRAGNLVNEITQCLRQEGDGYYTDAFTTYRAGNSYFETEEYDTAKNKYIESESIVLEANKSYSLMEPPETVLLNNAHTLYNDILGKLRDIAIIEADELYVKAFELYEKEPPKYQQVKKYAGEALDIYIEYNHPDGIYKAQVVYDWAVNKIDEIRIYAESQKELGDEEFKLQNWNGAIEKYNLAKNAYILIEDEPNVEYCEGYIELATEMIEADEDKLRAEAERYYDEAKFNRLREDYYNASLSVNLSRARYHQLFRIAESIGDRAKEKLYAGRIEQCYLLLAEINKDIENKILSDEAYILYGKAYDSYRDGDYENASVLVNQALKKYQEASNLRGISDCQLLINNLKGKFDIIAKAQEYYAQSLYFYENAFYDNATYYANKSLEIYTNISREGDIRKVNALLADIQKGRDDKAEADELYERAVGFYNIDDLDNAERETNNAKAKYEEINWIQGVEKCDKLLEDIDVKRGQPSIVELLRKFIPVVIFLTVVAIVIWWNSERGRIRRAEREKTEAEEKRKDEERLAKERADIERKEARRREIEEERKKSKDVVTLTRKRLKEGSPETLEELSEPEMPFEEPDMPPEEAGSLESEVLKKIESEELEEEPESLESEVLKELEESGEPEMPEPELPFEEPEMPEPEMPPEPPLEEPPAEGEESQESRLAGDIEQPSKSAISMERERMKEIEDGGGLGKSVISAEREIGREKDAMMKEAIKEAREKQATEPEDKAIDEEVKEGISEIEDLFGKDEKKKKK